MINDFYYEKKDLVLGIDTSNYKTSVALVESNGTLLFNHQELLNVKNGERGLRQSEAFFQHEMKLPTILRNVLDDDKLRERIGAVSCSVKPRPIEGSYMPCFLAGKGAAEIIAASLKVPLFEFSHQEGHIEAVKFYSVFRNINKILCFHFSGGTTEAILVDKENSTYEIVGGTKDISYGQVLDRVGVSLGFDFPSGVCLDKIACNTFERTKELKTPEIRSGYVNLSGIETQCQRAIENLEGRNYEPLVEELFYKLSCSIMEMTSQLSRNYKVSNFLYCGGVSSSLYVRDYIERHLTHDVKAVFGDTMLSSDNAIGIALLGGKEIWP